MSEVTVVAGDEEPPLSGHRRAESDPPSEASRSKRPSSTSSTSSTKADGGRAKASGSAAGADGQPGSDHESVLDRFEHMLAQIRQGACIPERTTLMGELVGLLHSPECPEPLRRRGLEVVGRLARRETCEPACKSGLDKMQSRSRTRETG